MTHKRAILHPTIRNAIDWQDVNEGTPGDLPPGRIGVYTARGERVAHVGQYSWVSDTYRRRFRPPTNVSTTKRASSAIRTLRR